MVVPDLSLEIQNHLALWCRLHVIGKMDGTMHHSSRLAFAHGKQLVVSTPFFSLILHSQLGNEKEERQGGRKYSKSERNQYAKESNSELFAESLTWLGYCNLLKISIPINIFLIPSRFEYVVRMFRYSGPTSDKRRKRK